MHSMCDNPLTKTKGGSGDDLLGKEECTSPFGAYELKIPVDKSLACNDPRMRNFNCKDLDVSYATFNIFSHAHSVHKSDMGKQKYA